MDKGTVRPVDSYVVSGAIFLKDGGRIFAEVSEDELKEPMRSLFVRAKRYWKSSKDHEWAMFIATEMAEASEFIYEAWNNQPSSSVDETIRLLRNENLREAAAKAGSDLISTRDIDEIKRITETLVKASQSSRKVKAVSNEEMYMQFLLDMDTVPEYTGTGFRILDRMTFIEQGDFIIVAGRPSTGKTAFTLQMMLNMAKQGKKCAYFSLETNSQKLYQRAVACYHRISYDHVKTRHLSAEEEEIINRSADDFLALPFHFFDAAGMTAEQIEYEAVQMGADVIFVDYLGIVSDPAKGRYEKITNNSINLHTLAQRNKITVVALSQLRRNQGVKLSKPRMDDLRESGQIEADADLILMLFNEAKDVIRAQDPSEDTAEESQKRILLDDNPYRLFWVSVEKNKEGITGDVEFNFFGEQQRFTELEEELREY